MTTIRASSVISGRRPPPLPRYFLLHTMIALFAIALGLLLTVSSNRQWLPESQVLDELSTVLGFLIISMLVIYFIFYIVAYPIIHTAQRYRGESQTAWIVWLCVELCGFGFGIVRLLYFFMHILPDLQKDPPYSRDVHAKFIPPPGTGAHT